MLEEKAVGELQERLRGRTVGPLDSGYDEARAVWNASIDRKPALVIYCEGPGDVQEAVRFGRRHDLLTSIRAGAHNVAGNATNDGGLVIDVRSMTDVEVDADTRTVSCGPGLIWAELDAATQEHALAVPGGLISTTGVAGFTLGGGFGWISRRFGLACDNLLSAEVVTADGEKIRASRTENADLFWGLRGGGGNFGVVTRFEFALAPVGPEVAAGLVFFPAERLAEVASFFSTFIEAAPDEVFMVLVMRLAPPAPFLPEEVHGKPVVAIGACYSGPSDAGMETLGPIKALKGSVADLIEPRPYLQFQSLLDASWTPGFQNYWKAEYLAGLPASAADVLAENLTTITSPLSDFKIATLGGAIARVDPFETAYSFRSAPFVLNVNSRWSEHGEADKHVAWTRSLWEQMRPYSGGGVYVNFMGEEGEDRVRAAYGDETYERLARVKAKYDPDNFFRMNQNIKPAT